MIRAILFDLGDTLLNFKPMDNRVIAREGSIRAHQRMQQRGCKVPTPNRYLRANMAGIRWALLKSWLTGREFNGLHIMRKYALRYGAPNDDAFMNELAWEWYQPVLPYGSIEPDLISTLELFKNEGLKMGIVSNTFIAGPILDRHLELVGMAEQIPTRIYSSEFGYRKPNPVIYKAALKAIGADARHTLFVGDVVKNDVIGPVKMGMKTALKLKPGRNYGNSIRHADHVIRRISDLIPILFPKLEMPATESAIKSVDPIPQSPALHA